MIPKSMLLLHPKRASNGFTVVESLVVLALLFVLTVLIASLARHNIGAGAADTKRELTPSVPESVSSTLADPAEDKSPPPTPPAEKEAADSASEAVDPAP